MNWNTLKRAGLALAAVVALGSAARAEEQPYAFNVLNQRSIALTSQYWNPILIYVSKKSGVPLELKLARTTKEANSLAEQGAFHFIYTNHFFTPERDRLGFRVIARPAGPGIRGQIVVPNNSPIRTLQELNGKEIAFASPDAFASYWLPMDALLKSKVDVKVVFTNNQEAGLAQLKVGTVSAAGVNDQIIQRYARREGFEYRLLWNSEVYNDLCIMASSKVPAAKIAAVRDALINMMNDPEGRKVIEAGAELLKIKDNLGFIAATDRDYDNYRAFYKKTLVKAAN
ncbi:MAG TPA: phosphate/phosphite/phosphonate ABC transporter substrate-binding protein [Burkholderiales bacterium]|jgi:phosphonate transport system substrate-binding protein|nr:phosphate/phosphite/phosphonate ABC transporter substrate-binding protein [Burkholderiales bacterium]